MPNAYEPFDSDYLHDLVLNVFNPIFQTYFRPVLLGAHKLPQSGPIVLAANHSGNAFPYDGMVLDGLLWQHHACDPAAKYRSVFEKELAFTWWMRPFGIDNFWRRGGGVDLTFDNFNRLLGDGHKVIYYPEGVAGIGKGFNRRYQLQRFSTSFIILSARHRAPVYPVYIINCEWIMPYSYTFGALDRLVTKTLGIPFLPLPTAPLGILFPFMWYSALPVRMVFVVGDPIDTHALARRHGETDFERPNRSIMNKVAEEVRVTMQCQLDRYVTKYGRAPYRLRSLGRALKRARRTLIATSPLAWPAQFVGHERDRVLGEPRSKLRWLARDWDLLGYYLPFGWWLLALARKLRKPPFGYRGLSSADRMHRTGSFHWDLREHPIPMADKDSLNR